MSKNRSRKKNVREQMKTQIYKRYIAGKGMKRHELKKEGKEQKVITSNQSFRRYKANINRFGAFCQLHGIKKWQDGEKLVKEYLEGLEQSGLRPTTIKNYAAAIGKLYQCDYNAFGYNFQSCNRADVVNNRGAKESHKNIDPSKYADATYFLDNSGLRRHEVKAGNVEFVKQKGKLIVKVQAGKGGKFRKAEWVGSEEGWLKCKEDFEISPIGLSPYKMPSNYYTHRHRQTYAKALYKKYARPIETLLEVEKYRCRGELKGIVYDRDALLIVQKNLGHNDLHCITRYIFEEI